PENNASAPVPLPGGREDRAWSQPHRAIDLACEVNAEEWKRGVGDRVDQASDEIGSLGFELPVLTAKRDDARCRALSRCAGQAVGVQSRAYDDAVGAQRVLAGEHHPGLSTGPIDALDRRTRADHTPAGAELVRERQCHA